MQLYLASIKRKKESSIISISKLTEKQWLSGPMWPIAREEHSF